MRESVLIVEDDADLRDTLTSVLQAHGYEVVAAESADEALRFLRAEGGACIVLLDWIMRKSTGDEVLQALAAESALSRTEVVVLTGAPAKFHPAGVRVVMKPVDLDQLLETVKAACGADKRNTPPNTPSGGDGAP